MVWEIVFMLLILKIPIVYLCVVVWYAIRDEPRPAEPVGVVAIEDTPPAAAGPQWTRGRRPRPSGHPRPSRRPGRPPRVATSTRAEVRQ